MSARELPLKTTTVTGADDAALLQGSVEQFAELYERYAGRAYRVARSVLHEPHGAQDAVQDAFLSIWRSRDTYRPEHASAATWLLSIVHHRAIDAMRRNRKHAGVSSAEEQLAEPVGELDVGYDVAGSHDARVLRELLRALPAVQREVIVLSYFGELSASEIAAETGAPLGTVKSRMRLGLERLHRDLEA